MSNTLDTPLDTRFAQPRVSLGPTSLRTTVSGKLSRFLARNLRTKSIPMRNAQPLISFTFDDVPASACSVGARILEDHGARGTLYISGGGCGRDSPGGRLATADELRALHSRGHELGCHTYSHLAVSDNGFKELDYDFERNKAFLNHVTGESTTRNFAYPYGDFSFRTKRHLESRFGSCRSLIPGLHSKAVDLGALKTFALDNSSIDQAGITDLIDATVRQTGWLIFSGHDVDNKPSKFGVSPDLLAYALYAAKEASCRIVTVAAALDLVRGAPAHHRQSTAPASV